MPKLRLTREKWMFRESAMRSRDRKTRAASSRRISKTPNASCLWTTKQKSSNIRRSSSSLLSASNKSKTTSCLPLTPIRRPPSWTIWKSRCAVSAITFTTRQFSKKMRALSLKSQGPSRAGIRMRRVPSRKTVKMPTSVTTSSLKHRDSSSVRRRLRVADLLSSTPILDVPKAHMSKMTTSCKLFHASSKPYARATNRSLKLDTVTSKNFTLFRTMLTYSPYRTMTYRRSSTSSSWQMRLSAAASIVKAVSIRWRSATPSMKGLRWLKLRNRAHQRAPTQDHPSEQPLIYSAWIHI